MATPPERGRPWGRVLAWAAGLVWLLTAAALLGFFVARALPHAARDADSQVIVREMRKMAKLATVEAREAEILKVGSSTPVLGIFESRKEAVLLARGRVLAGIDLEKATFEVEEDAHGKRLVVHLPEAEILAVEDDVEFYGESSGYFAPIEPSDRHEWMVLARAALRRAALQNGIRERATEHAQALLGGLANGLGYRVVFASGSSTTPGPRPGGSRLGDEATTPRLSTPTGD